MFLNYLNKWLTVSSKILVLSICTCFFAIVVTSCGGDEDNNKELLENRSQSPLVMVLKNQGDEFSQLISDHLLQILDYTKIPFLTLDLRIISQDFQIPQSVRSILITTEIFNQFSSSDIQQLVDFVARGNTIIFTGPFSSEETSFLQGLKPDTDFSIDSTNSGVKILKDIFPESAQNTYKPNGATLHYGLKKDEFSNEIEIYAATASDPEAPFIYGRKVGLGEVITINSYAINEKPYRGYIFSTLLKGLDGVPYHVANVSTIFLDDFPAPLYNQMMAPVDKEFGVTQADFVVNIWWPDMKALADSLNMSYSAMTAFNYNANVVPPFDFNEWQGGLVSANGDSVEGSILLGRDIVRSRHELAFHGYNHFSLLMEEWPNINFMISALQAARKRWRVDNLGSLPTNYVPPTNQIDSAGMEAIIRGMPSIKFMSSLYFGQIEDGGLREFGPDPYVPAQIFNYPRITSGNNMNEVSLLDQQGMQLLTGIWNHFVHPDDVFQVTQRDEDEFKSRNPLGLGWRSDSTYGYGLFDLFKRRIEFTQKRYPLVRFVTATEGAKRAQDWRRSFTHYSIDDDQLNIETDYRANYSPHIKDSSRSWFMYVPKQQTIEVEQQLEVQEISYEKSKIWNGFLYQFMINGAKFSVPNLDDSYFYDPDFLNTLVANQKQIYQSYNQLSTDLNAENWVDTRLEDAIREWKRNSSYANEERVISLSLEFDQTSRAIQILETRLKTSEIWASNDTTRLITYYGYEGMQVRASEFLEELWTLMPSSKVIALKDLAVRELGLFGDEFTKRWGSRAIQLNPDDYTTLLAYAKSIESQENWPEMKGILRQLLDIRPQSDSLYAFTIQRSFYYDPPDSTIALLQEFPDFSYSQLLPFASNFAYIYAYDLENYEEALFWANNAPDFDEKQKLYWLSQLGLKQLYLAKAKQLIEQNPADDSLRSFIGTNLFYEGFNEASYAVLYPLFENNNEAGFAADTLIRNEIGYMSYEQKKAFYKRYPLFFNAEQEDELISDNRRTEGLKASLYGVYRRDNFNNNWGRAGASVQFGNRRDVTHSFKAEEFILSDDPSRSNSLFNYQGLGYEYGHLMNEQRLQLNAGSTVLFGEGDVVPEAMVSLGLSVDSTFSSLQLKGGSVLTATSLRNDYYYLQLQGYRQDFWMNGDLSTALSTSGKYYTNSVMEYSGQIRLFYEPFESDWRIRPVGEIGYADATESYLSGLPYYTPDQYFSQGLGVDLQYRKPNTFEYRTQLTAELMGRHERRDGFFVSGRVAFEHKFRNFWELSLGSEFSTSKVYRSNQFFVTISHYFGRNLNGK